MTTETRAGVLVLLRHGESTANAAKDFTGRHDVDLTDRGVAQARRAAELLREAVPPPDVALTSPMLRADRTARVVRDVVRPGLRLERTWRLVERDYGCLTGMPKRRARTELGPERFFTLRRTRHGRPPALDQATAQRLDLYEEPGSPLAPAGGGESLDDVVQRVRPCWQRIRGELDDGRVVLVVAHGNSLRALSALVDGLDDTELEQLNLPPGQPLMYVHDGTERLSPRGGRYLDPTNALAATAEIAREGGT